MEASVNVPDRWADTAQGILRIVAGFIFWMHGAQKLLGLFGGLDGQGATVEIASLIGVAGILEFVGGILIVIGLFTRPVAFILCGEMAYAFFTAHLSRGTIWPLENGGEPAVLYAFIFLFFAAAGSGAFAVDRILAKRKRVGHI
jgi:putative oxidoreductase